MRFESVLVTPELAKYYLENNAANRNISAGAVAAYARDMLAGAWKETGQNNICISKNGELKDGQHRLLAVIKAGIPVRMNFAFDVDDDVSVYDRGRSRSVADELRMAYYGNGSLITQNHIVGAISQYIKIKNNRASRITATDIKQVIDGKEDWIANVASGFTGSGSLNTRQSSIILSALFASKNGVSTGDIHRFAKVLQSGFYDDDDETAAIVLRNDFISHRLPKSNSIHDTKLKVVCCERAISDFANRKSRKISYIYTQGFTWDFEL